MSNWQEAAAARLDHEASWWYTQTLDNPDAQKIAEELWGEFWQTRTKKPEVVPVENKNAVFGAVDIVTRGVDDLRLEVPITLADAISDGTQEVYSDGREYSVRVMAGEICRRALGYMTYAQTVSEVRAESPISADEVDKAA